MLSRIDLHAKLVTLLGSKYVYFQPPETLKLTYPCIVYERHDIDNTHADNDVYMEPVKYRVTIIDQNPDSQLVEKMNHFGHNVRFVRHFATEGLNHDIFDIYY